MQAMASKEEPIKQYPKEEEEERGSVREEAKRRWPKIDLSVLEKDKETYITCLVLSVISIVVMTVMIHLYLGLLEHGKPVIQPFDELRDALVDATGEEKFKKCHPKKIAEEVKLLPYRINSSNVTQNELFNHYLKIKNKPRVSYSCRSPNVIVPTIFPNKKTTGMKQRTSAFPKVHTWPPSSVMMKRGPHLHGRSSHYTWQSHGKSSYYFSKGEKTWYEAEDFCISRGGHLTSILSNDEQNFISSQLKNALWIGLTTGNKEGSWRWLDGSRMEKENWFDGQPSNRRRSWKPNQDCVVMDPTLSNRNWKVNSCHKLHRWVCKEI